MGWVRHIARDGPHRCEFRERLQDVLFRERLGMSCVDGEVPAAASQLKGQARPNPERECDR